MHLKLPEQKRIPQCVLPSFSVHHAAYHNKAQTSANQALEKWRPGVCLRAHMWLAYV
jgi:hypothetical protein